MRPVHLEQPRIAALASEPAGYLEPPNSDEDLRLLPGEAVEVVHVELRPVQHLLVRVHVGRQKLRFAVGNARNALSHSYLRHHALILSAVVDLRYVVHDHDFV